MFLGVEIGLGVAVILSLLIVLYETAYPHTAVLGRLQGSSVYRNVKQYPEAEHYDGIVICRIDAPLYFANTEYIREVSVGGMSFYGFRAQVYLRQLTLTLFLIICSRVLHRSPTET